MNYTFKVVNTTIKDSADLSKIVVSCSWYKQGQDDNGNLGKCYSRTEFNISQIDYEAFVPFDELTEDIVLLWIQNSISETDNTYLNNCIEQDLQKSLYPEMTVMPPWEVVIHEQQIVAEEPAPETELGTQPDPGE
jgi:hypothetical protein